MDFSERIGRRLKLQDLHILMTVAQVGSMGTAARRLNTTQPAVSRTIAELESAVGVRLLDRSPQGVEPTACGRALLHCSATVFDHLRQGVKNIEFLNNPTLGEIRIGADEPTMAGLLSTMLGRLHRRYPGITVHMTHLGELEQQHRELRERKIDLVIGRLGSNIEGDVETQNSLRGQHSCRCGITEPLELAAETSTIRIGERTVGLSALGFSCRHTCQSSLPRAGNVSARGGDRVKPSAVVAPDEGTFSDHGPRFCADIREQPSAAQNFTCRAAYFFVVGRNHDFERSNDQPGGSTLPGLRPRSCGTAPTTKANDAASTRGAIIRWCAGSDPY